jgi:hypothetical protein
LIHEVQILIEDYLLNIIMRLHEFSNPLKHYMATVRVVLYGSSSTVRTTITADCASDAKKLLAAIVGDNNVLSLSHIVTEAPQIDQIQREQAIRPQAACRRAQPPKVAQIQPSQVRQQRKGPQRRRLSTRAIADPIKHNLVQDRLTKQFMRQSNIVKPTSDDIRIARNRAETELKKADLDFKKQSDELRRKLVQQRRKK